MRKIESEVGEYVEYCEKVRGMSITTMSMKKNVLWRFLDVVGVNSIEELSNFEFDKWVGCEVERGISAQSVNMYSAVVVAMVRYFKDMGVNVPLNLNLIKKMKVVVMKRKFYTREEIERVVELADVETELMILVMFETGMRISELTRLSTSEIEGRKISFVGKGKKTREVYMSALTAERFSDFLGGRVGYVWGFASLNGEPPTVNTVRNRLCSVFFEAGFDGFYPHALRHSFATYLQSRGASVAEIKEMMGHSSVATTERYLHGFEGRLRELFDKSQ